MSFSINFPPISGMASVNSHPYPGLKATFVLDPKQWIFARDGSWKDCSEGLDLVRCFEFTSATKESLIKKMALLGHNDRSIKILVTFDKKNSLSILNYFQEHKVALELQPSTDAFGYKTRNLEETRNLFKILEENNEFPAEHLPLMKKIVEAGDWTKITPLEEPMPAVDEHKKFLVSFMFDRFSDMSVSSNSEKSEKAIPLKQEPKKLRTRAESLAAIRNHRIPVKRISEIMNQHIIPIIKGLDLEGITESEFRAMGGQGSLPKPLSEDQKKKINDLMKASLEPVLIKVSKEVLDKVYVPNFSEISDEELDCVVNQLDRKITRASLFLQTNDPQGIVDHFALKKFNRIDDFTQNLVNEALSDKLYKAAGEHRDSGRIFQGVDDIIKE